MSDTNTNPYWDSVEQILTLFYPQYFDPNSPQYVDSDILAQLDIIAMEARPPCLKEGLQNLAEAMYMAYLISLRTETTSGQNQVTTAGPIISEKEGDISVTYADMTKTGANTNTLSKRPPSDPWDAWNRLWMRCATGAITTRYGDPMRSGAVFTREVLPIAYGVWRQAPYAR